MKNMMQHIDSVELNVIRRTSNLGGIALATLMAVGTLAPLAACQNAYKTPEPTGDQVDSQDKLMTQAELEQTSAHLARELKTAVEQGTITSRQMGHFKIADVQRVIRDKQLSPREATDRLRLYQKLANGLMAGTLSGDEAVKRIQTFNVMANADVSKNWVSGIWVIEDAKEDDPDKDLALFASTSGEIALGFLSEYTISEDETVKMVFTKPGDGVSPDVTLDMFFSRDAAGDVTMHEKREGRIEGEDPEETTLPVTPRESALVSPDDERWIIGWWTLHVGDRPYALCFFPDGSMWFATHHNGVCRFDGTSFTHFTTKHGVEGHEAWNLYEDSSGNIWFPIENSGVYRYDGKSFTRFHTKQGLTSNGSSARLKTRKAGSRSVATWDSSATRETPSSGSARTARGSNQKSARVPRQQHLANVHVGRSNRLTRFLKKKPLSPICDGGFSMGVLTL